MTDPVLSARSTRNQLIRYRGPNDPAVIEAERVLAAEKIAAYASRIVAAAPPLADEQIERIAALLRPAGSRISAA